MNQINDLRYRELPLHGGTGAMPALGFGTLIHDAADTRNSTRTALEVGFRIEVRCFLESGPG
jgi:alcohol dehydrogenase (NADP+)